MTTDTMMEQEDFTPEAPVAEHDWLQRFLGDWSSEGPGATGSERVVALGGLWVVGDGIDETGAWQSQVTLGFNAKSGKFVGSWVGGMMSHQWVYEGTREGNTLTLECEGPAFDGSAHIQRYRDVHEFIDDDHRVLRASVQEADGSWTQFMTTTYTRTA